MRRLIVFSLLALAILAFSRAGGEDELVYGEFSAPLSLWPYFSDDPVTLRTLDLYFRPLIYNFSDAYNSPRDYIECLVERIEPDDISWDRLPHLKLTLKEAYWSNGEPLTVDDVVKTFRLLRSRKINTVYKFIVDAISYIKGDGKNIKINFEYPSKSLLSAMNFFVLPARLANPSDYLELSGDQEEVKNWSNGPYVIENVNLPKDITFVENKGYPDVPFIKKVTLKIVPDMNALIDQLAAGKLDMIMDIPPSIVTTRINQRKEQGGVKTRIKALYYIENRFYYIAFNYRKPIFQDVQFRRDLIRALNREELGRVFGAMTEKISGPFVPGSVWSNPAVSFWEYDPNVDLSKYNKYGTIRLVYPALQEYRNLAAGIIVQWRDAGLKNVKRDEVKLKDFWNRLRRGDFDIALLEYVGARNFATLSPLLSCRGSQNFAKFNCYSTFYDKDIADLLEKVEGSEAFDVSSEKRLEYYQKLHKLLHDKEIHLWLFTVQRSVFYDSDLDIPYISPSRPFKSITMWKWK